MSSKIVPIICLAFAFIVGMSPVFAQSGFPGDVAISGAGDAPLTGGRVALIGGSIYMTQGRLTPPKIQAMIVILAPPHYDVTGGGTGSDWKGDTYEGEQPMDIEPLPIRRSSKTKQITLKYKLETHKKTVTIANRQFDWVKNKIFLVVYDKNFKPSSYALTNNFTGAYLPVKTLKELRKKFPQGINSSPSFNDLG